MLRIVIGASLVRRRVFISILKLSFNANLFREVLSANKECESAKFEVSGDGLSRISFKIDDYESTYYLV